MNSKYTQNLRKRVGRTITNQQLLAPNDKVMVALSGGKDSLVLLEILRESQKVLPFQFELLAVHIQNETIGYEADVDFLANFCSDLNVEFMLEPTTTDISNTGKKPICFVCAWSRRKALFNLSRRLGYNKLALGHHMDDAVQTLFMNMIYRGSISSMPFKLSMFDGRMELIRPLLEISEEDILKFCYDRNYTFMKKQCQFQETKRADMAELISSIKSQFPNATKNIFRSMDTIHSEYLPHW